MFQEISHYVSIISESSFEIINGQINDFASLITKRNLEQVSSRNGL